MSEWGTWQIGIRAGDWIDVVEIMCDTTTTMVISPAMREDITGMMQEVITHELGNREGHVDGDQAAVLFAPQVLISTLILHPL